MNGACVYWKAEFPPQDRVGLREHLAGHQETGWAGSPLLTSGEPSNSLSPVPGAFLTSACRGAHISSSASTSCAQSPNHSSKTRSATPLDKQGIFPTPGGAVPLPLPPQACPAGLALGAGARSSSQLDLCILPPSRSFLSPDKVKVLAHKTGSQSLTPTPQFDPKDTASQVLGPLVTSSFFVWMESLPPPQFPCLQPTGHTPPACQPREILIACLPNLYNYRLWPQPCHPHRLSLHKLRRPS